MRLRFAFSPVPGTSSLRDISLFSFWNTHLFFFLFPPLLFFSPPLPPHSFLSPPLLVFSCFWGLGMESNDLDILGMGSTLVLYSQPSVFSFSTTSSFSWYNYNFWQYFSESFLVYHVYFSSYCPLDLFLSLPFTLSVFSKSAWLSFIYPLYSFSSCLPASFGLFFLCSRIPIPPSLEDLTCASALSCCFKRYSFILCFGLFDF